MKCLLKKKKIASRSTKKVKQLKRLGIGVEPYLLPTTYGHINTTPPMLLHYCKTHHLSGKRLCTKERLYYTILYCTTLHHYTTLHYTLLHSTLL